MYKQLNGVKLGNMRAVKDWSIYPKRLTPEDQTVMIQCDNRIATVDLATGKGVISDGKGGHQGGHKLNKFLGAKDIDVPPEVVERLKGLVETNKQHVLPDGGVLLSSLT